MPETKSNTVAVYLYVEDTDETMSGGTAATVVRERLEAAKYGTNPESWAFVGEQPIPGYWAMAVDFNAGISGEADRENFLTRLAQAVPDLYSPEGLRNR